MEDLAKEANFEQELCALLNRYGKDTETETPDYILAQFLTACIKGLAVTNAERDAWFNDRMEGNM